VDVGSTIIPEGGVTVRKWLVAVLVSIVVVFALGQKVTIIANAIKGGKNTQVVDWFEKYIPEIEKDLGIKVELIQTGIKDEDFKARIVLDIKGGGGADILWIDGFWVPILAEIPAWKYYYDSMKAMGSYKGKTYLVPASTDVRMIYYNKELFKKAGIPVPWQPKSWEDIIKTARIIKEKLPGARCKVSSWSCSALAATCTIGSWVNGSSRAVP